MAMIMLWRCDGQSLNWPGRVKVVNNKYHVTLESCLFADHAFHLLLILGSFSFNHFPAILGFDHRSVKKR